MRHALRELGAVNGATVPIAETLLDSKALWLTPNTDTVYAVNWIDLTNGPVVIESPPETLGIVDDMWFNYVTDLGFVGPDKGKGGKYLFLPPGYKGEVPEGYFVFRPRTFGNWYLTRGFLVDGSPKGRVESFKKHLRIYPLSQAANPPEQKFMNLSGVPHNTIHATDYGFFEEINQLVQDEPNEAIDPETLGLLASIGIEEGQAVRAGCADEEDPDRGGGGGQRHGPDPHGQAPDKGDLLLPGRLLAQPPPRRRLRVP